jgi:UMF1 family MFS transporter
MKNSFKFSREEKSWVLYDVGNSAFVLVMVTAIMPIYFKDIIAVSMTAAESTARWGFANSTASLVLAILAPLLGAMADYKNRKKRYLVCFLLLGVLFTVLLFFVEEKQWMVCLAFFVAARVGWAGANIFYDAFLVDVTTESRMDRVSTLGYAYGYIGSVVPFLLIVALIFSAGVAGGLPPTETRFGFLIVAVWWLALAMPAIKNLKQRHFKEEERGGLGGFKELYATFREIRTYRRPFLFLLAYFFYIDGVGTIISMSTAYGRDLGFGATILLIVLLFIQIVAFPFAILFGRLAEDLGVNKMLYAGIVIYCIATILGFFLPLISSPAMKLGVFWLIAFLIASAMGGIQALSRSYFARLIPAAKSGQFFGFYNVFGKFAAICGPFLMGLVTLMTGETRWGLLSILPLFLIGALLLAKVDTPEETAWP